MRLPGSTASNTPAGCAGSRSTGSPRCGQDAHRCRGRPERPHDDPAVDRVRAQHAVRIGVLARDHALDLPRRHTARTTGAPASSVRGSDRDGIGIVNLPRSSGILLHVTSLPGGRLGTAAYSFVDWLAAAGQSWWQVLPLGPPDRSGSPYTSSSAFAGWPGLLAEPEAPGEHERAGGIPGRPCLLDRRLGALRRRGAAADQVRFEREWSDLRRYAAARGVRLIGDIPLYVGARSADHLAHPEHLPARLRGGRPARRPQRDRAALGQPALRLAGAAGAGLPLVDRAPAARVPAVRRGAHRPLPRLRRLLVGAGRAPAPPGRAAGGAGPGRPCSRRRSASSARWR